MATILLSAAGAALGGSVGGTVLGLSMAAVGRFAGALIGQSIDQRLLGEGSEAVETGRVERLRLTGAGEGDAIAQVYGRMRVGGQVIWATEFTETVTVTGGGKGVPSQPETASYSYSVSLAIALCEGEITDVGRIWADGNEMAPDDLNMRVYRGTADQLPDPKIEAVEGPGLVPAYRGTAYVVIEDLALGPYGNRVPQFTFEVSRPAPIWQDGAELDPAHAVRGVAMLPGSGEYALASAPVQMFEDLAGGTSVNINTPSAKPDFLTSLDRLTGEMPGCGAVSLIVSWFGDDLRCGECRLQPKVEQSLHDGFNMPWQAGGLGRMTAPLVTQDGEGRPIYGGTPADAAVIQAIAALSEAGQEVMYYPFILMDQTAGNGLPDPYSDAGDQPVLPWRGRITLSEAPGRPGSPDGTAAAEAEVAAFFGTVGPGDFSLTEASDATDPQQPPENQPVFGPPGLPQPFGAVYSSPVVYDGPADDWGYRRFILHQAALCAAAGGVESFCIGSEMRGLTRIRGENSSFPAVAALVALAADVRTILGPDVKITYAADWSEYSGYQPQDGSGDRFFHLDALWADANIDFIGIDNYMPLSDWRDGTEHADAHWGAIYNPDYLRANIEGGERYDWYYHSPEARAAQIRTPITDGDHGEPWIWRVKDLRNWWLNEHHDRVGGVRAEAPTAWVPQSKPIRFTEMGCAAVDKGTNQPNRFLDPKSSESGLPRHSDGRRDDLIQRQYLRAMIGYWTDPAHNPVSAEYGAPMLDMDHAYVWAWDARPFPFFPNNRELWRDGDNYATGHWLTGRASARSLASVADEICRRAGLPDCDTSALYGIVRGYAVERVAEARAALQPLMLRHGFDALDRDGRLRFALRDGRADVTVEPGTLVRGGEQDGVLEETRASAAELAGRVRLRFIESDADYEVIAEEAILHDEETHAVSTSEFALSMTRAEGRQTVERWLSEARVAIDRLRLTLPPSQLAYGAGDVLALPEAGGQGLFRIDRVELLGHAQKVEAVRIEPESYNPIRIEDTPPGLGGITAPAPIVPVFLDLPLLTGAEVPHAPHLAVMADPWRGAAALYAADTDAGYRLNTTVTAPTPVALTETPLAAAPSGRIDSGPGLQVKMLAGGLESVSDAAFLAGGNLCAIGDGSPGGWELLQFRDAEMTGPDTYLLSHRLRGQLGTEKVQSGAWPAGSLLVRIDGTPQQITLNEAAVGLERHYRIGPSDRPVGDPSYLHLVLAFAGIGLRPYSPVHLRAAPLADGGMALSWIRRTRIGGDRWTRPEVPLGEESESYLVRIVQAGTVVREETVGTPAWVYTAAAQSADAIFGVYEVQVAQLSAAFGPGPPASLSLTA